MLRIVGKAYKSQNDEALCSCSVKGEDKNRVGQMAKALLHDWNLLWFIQDYY